MVFGDLQAERRELHHTASINLRELATTCREYEWRWVSEVDEPEMTGWMHFPVKHSRNLASIVFLTPAKRVSSRDRFRQPQIDLLKQLRRRFPMVIKFGEHQGMKRVVHSGCNLL